MFLVLLLNGGDVVFDRLYNGREDLSAALIEKDLAISQGRIANLKARAGDMHAALDYYGKSLTNYDALFAAGFQNTITRRDFAMIVAKAATTYAQLDRWPEARSAYQRSLDVYVELRGKGVLLETDASKSEELAREIVKCEARLAKLR